MNLRASLVLGVAVLLMGPQTPALAQACFPWVHRTKAGPSPRGAHAMAYDSARGVTVLFGGADPSVNGDTWEWDGTSWTLRSSSGPSPRAGHAMAYDIARGVTVLFGGASYGYDGETWEWDGTSWTLRSSSGPSPRTYHAMAYDSARGVTVLFGGEHSEGYYGDTWEWDGPNTSWTLRSSSGPSARYAPAMAYDSARGVTVLFGGYDGNWYGDTWEWDGPNTSWTLRSSSGPSPRAGHAMAYDSARGVTVLFGGNIDLSYNYKGDTWEWDGTSWTLRSSSGPSPRVVHAMAYDIARGVTVLFGGNYDFDGGIYFFLRDTWETAPSGEVRTLSITLKKAATSWVDIDPNDPNWTPYVYPTGMVLTLTAVPAGGKSFKTWNIWDPNYCNDANHILIDTNNPIIVVMDCDRRVEAVFNCGGGIGPLLVVMLGVLGVYVAARRRR